MSTTTHSGRALREELNDAYRLLHPDLYIPFDRLGDVSLLARRAKRYATRQERACSEEGCWGDEWDRQEARLEEQITELALSLPGIVGVRFTGDPRGFTVRLLLAVPRTNCWGDERNEWGIA